MQDQSLQYKPGELITFNDFFQKYKMKFEIPNYQRGYSWEKEQRLDLLEDIEFCTKKEDYIHYMGTIVVAMLKESEYYDIVDGQQRLLSIFILVNRIFYYMNKEDGENPFNYLKNWFKTTGNYLIPNKEVNGNSFFNKYILDNDESIDKKEITNKSKENVINARKEFDKWIDKNIDRVVDAKVYLKIILHRLGFKIYIPNNNQEIGIMFEVINNRGKALSELEKVKNYLVYYSQKSKADKEQSIEHVVEDRWGNILNNLSSAGKTKIEDENSFLSAAWIVFCDPMKKKSYHVYENLKSKDHYSVEQSTKQDVEDLIKFVKFLEKCSKYYRDLFKSDDNILMKLRFHTNHAAILPLYFAISNAKSDKNDKYSQDSLLAILEKLNFRVYMTPGELKVRSDKYQSILYKLAYKFYNKPINKDDLKKELISFIKNKAPLRKFVKSLTLDRDEDFDYYTWKGLRYFLANYEISLPKNKGVEKPLLTKFYKKQNNRFIIEKEHLWAKEGNGENKEKEKHEKKRLGNFALLEKRKNISAGNKDISEKLNACFPIEDGRWNTRLRMIEEVNKLLDQEKENLEDRTSEFSSRKSRFYWYGYYQYIIDFREEKMVNFAINRWGLKSEKKPKVIIDSFEAFSARETANIKNKDKKEEVFTIQYGNVK